jgi:hypothetical protein
MVWWSIKHGGQFDPFDHTQPIFTRPIDLRLVTSHFTCRTVRSGSTKSLYSHVMIQMRCHFLNWLEKKRTVHFFSLTRRKLKRAVKCMGQSAMAVIRAPGGRGLQGAPKQITLLALIWTWRVSHVSMWGTEAVNGLSKQTAHFTPTALTCTDVTGERLSQKKHCTGCSFF